MPGINFTGYEAPFHWNDITPRVGMTYALDENRKTILRASFSRNAGQLTSVGTYIGYANPSSAAGWVEYPWVDANGDHLAQTNEVQVNQPLLASGNGFNTANPTAVTSANRIDPDFRAPSSMGFIVGFDRELLPNLAMQVNYTYGRVTNHPMFPFIGVATSDWQSIAPLTGTLPDGTAYNVPLFQPNPTIVAANGGGRILTNFDGYFTKFNGIELSINKRMSNRWQMRLATAYNNPTEGYDDIVPVSENGNPTRSDIFPLVEGGQLAPRSAGSGSGDVFVNQRWSFNVNGAYQLPYNMEVAGNLFGKQGTPYPCSTATPRWAVKARRASCLTDELDAQRFDNLWNLDLRWAWNAKFARPRQPAVHRRSVQRVQQRHGDHARAQRRGDDVRRARLEPEPAHPALRRSRRTVDGSPRVRHARPPREISEAFSFARRAEGRAARGKGRPRSRLPGVAALRAGMAGSLTLAGKSAPLPAERERRPPFRRAK